MFTHIIYYARWSFPAVQLQYPKSVLVVECFTQLSCFHFYSEWAVLQPEIVYILLCFSYNFTYPFES